MLIVFASIAFVIAAVLLFFAMLLQRRLLLNRAANTILLRVSLPRATKPEETATPQPQQMQAEKERISIMEQLYALLTHLEGKKGLGRFLAGKPHIAFELAVPLVGEDIAFFVAVPRMWQETIEKTIHGIYEHAEIKRVEDYNIFHPGGSLAGGTIKFAKHWTLPFMTYQNLSSDPLRAISNSLTKLATEGEGAAVQILVRSPARQKGKYGLTIARQMQKSGHSFERARREVSLLGQISYALRGSSRREQARMREQQMISGASTPQAGGPLSASPASRPWFQEAWHPVTPLIQETVKALEGKAAKAVLEVNIRLLASAPSQIRADEILTQIIAAFAQFNAPHLNQLKIRKLSGRALRDLVFKFSFRVFDPMRALLVNTEEAASVFHFPNVPLETPKVAFLKSKPAPPPANLPEEGIILGENVFRGVRATVRLSEDDRRRHLYVVGQTGTGKTTILANLVKQDIEAGRGVGVIDPHGDLVERVLGIIPKDRAEDVILFDPGDLERPVGLNMLEWETPEQRDFAVQEMVAIFMKLFPPEVIGPMFEHNMRNAMLTIAAQKDEPGTIVEIPVAFTDERYIRHKLQYVTDPLVRAFWEKEMAKTTEFHKSEMLGYLVSKVGRFVENEMMRNIIGQPRSGFNVRKIMDERKIFLANLSKGKVGEVNAALLGLTLVSKMQLGAMSRADVPESERPDFYLYIDEFQSFVTDSIATILSEARKYRLNLTLAHQFIGQLPELIRNAVFGNVGSLVAFRVGAQDAEFLVKQFEPVFNIHDLVNIHNFNAYVKLIVYGKTERAFNIEIFPPTPPDAATAEAIRQLSRLRFGVPKAEVAQQIYERMKLGEQGLDAEQTFVPGERNR